MEPEPRQRASSPARSTSTARRSRRLPRSSSTGAATVTRSGWPRMPARASSAAMSSGMGFTFDDTDKKGVASPLAEMRRLIEDNPRNRQGDLPLHRRRGSEHQPDPCPPSLRHQLPRLAVAAGGGRGGGGRRSGERRRVSGGHGRTSGSYGRTAGDLGRVSGSCGRTRATSSARYPLRQEERRGVRERWGGMDRYGQPVAPVSATPGRRLRGHRGVTGGPGRPAGSVSVATGRQRGIRGHCRVMGGRGWPAAPVSVEPGRRWGIRGHWGATGGRGRRTAPISAAPGRQRGIVGRRGREAEAGAATAADRAARLPGAGSGGTGRSCWRSWRRE